MHVRPLQPDPVERIININWYSNKDDLVYDPCGGLVTVPMTAVRIKRRELNPDCYRDGTEYLQAAEDTVDEPALFDSVK